MTLQMAPRKVLLLSNSKLYGEEIFQWCSVILKDFLGTVKKLLFIPYASHDHDKYLSLVALGLEKYGIQIESIHNHPDPVKAVNECEGIFVGGGNTFLLLKTIYDKKLLEPIREAVLKRGIPYIGSSAGTNVATRSINTTNDMPICYPPSLEALKLVPFNINPHYVDQDVNSKHMGESREERIKEYLNELDSAVVLGLREGSALKVQDNQAILIGTKSAKLFQKNKDPVEYKVGDDLSFLLKEESS